MKTTTPENGGGQLVQRTIEAQMIKEAKALAGGAEIAARTACQKALLAGMRLVWLHSSSHSAGARNDLVPNGTRSGFEEALKQIGLSKTTAYRWINKTYELAGKLHGYCPGNFPSPEHRAEWTELEESLTQAAAGMSMRRIAMGASASNSEDERYDVLISRAESGDENAENVLELIASGNLTLVQAMRAAAGALATKGKTRNDPVYLSFDAETRKATGLLPKALTTLRNGFSDWDDYTPAARAALREEWQQTRLAMPDELFSTKK
jgi:hypothetical protein